MLLALLALPALVACSTPAVGQQPQQQRQGLRGTVEEPHFLTSTDSFLRTASDRVGQAVARVLGVQGSLEDMRQDLAGEYELWQEKKVALDSDKDRLRNESLRLQAILLEQQSLGEEKVKLQDQLALHRSETKKAMEAFSEEQRLWLPQREAMVKDIALLEDHIKVEQAHKIEQISAAENKTGEIQARNRVLQSQIFTQNQQVADLQREFANRTILNKQRHSTLLSEVAALQMKLHALQDEVVARAQMQLEVQRLWQRLSAQASEVVKQKEELQTARAHCEKDLATLETAIHSAQSSLKASNQKMAQCQRLDAQAQQLQGQVNECRAASRSGATN